MKVCASRSAKVVAPSAPASSPVLLSRRPAAGFRSVAQLVEHRSPKPGVAGSSPVTPAIDFGAMNSFLYE